MKTRQFFLIPLFFCLFLSGKISGQEEIKIPIIYSDDQLLFGVAESGSNLDFYLRIPSVNFKETPSFTIWFDIDNDPGTGNKAGNVGQDLYVNYPSVQICEWIDGKWETLRIANKQRDIIYISKDSAYFRLPQKYFKKNSFKEKIKFNMVVFGKGKVCFRKSVDSPLIKTGQEISVSTDAESLVNMISEDNMIKTGDTSNIFKDPGFENNGQEWQTESPATQAGITDKIAHSGKRSLFISSDNSDYKNGWASLFIPLSDKKIYNLSFWLKIKDINIDFTHNTNRDKALSVACLFYDKHGYMFYSDRIVWEFGTFDWNKYSSCIKAPPESKYMKLKIGLNNTSGSVWMDDISLEEEKNSLILSVHGKEFVGINQKNKNSKFNASPEELANGAVAFRSEKGEEILPWSSPERGEVINKIQLSAAAGEYEAASFALYALRDLKNLKVSLKTPIPGISTDIRIVECRPQLLTHDKEERRYSVMPEILTKEFPLLLARGTSQEYRIIFNVPEKAEGGDYDSVLHIESDDQKSFDIPLELHVYPFKLLMPENKFWCIGTTSLFCGDRKRIETELADIKEHGANSVTMSPNIRFSFSDGQPEANEDDLKKFKLFLACYKKAGFSGPLILRFGSGIERNISRGLKKGNYEEDPGKGNWSPALRENFKKAIGRIIVTLKESGLYEQCYYSGEDEPGVHGKKSQAMALMQYSLAKEAGMKTFVTADVDFTREMSEYLDIADYSLEFMALDKKQNAERQKDVQKSGNKMWWYGSGCYDGQNGLMPNRYLTGFLNWKTGAEGHHSWIYYWPFGDPYDDFDSGRKDFCIVYPSKEPWKKPIPTLQWEGIREGIDDARYVYTLEYYIKKCHDSGDEELRAKAADAGTKLKGILDSVPWFKEYERDKSLFANASADHLRSKIAGMIISLKADLEKVKNIKYD